MATVPETPVTGSASPSTAPGFFQKNKIWFIVIVIYVLSLAAVYFYQRHQQSRLRKEAYAEMDRRDRVADALTTERNEEAASNLCRAIVWGVRGEMERGNKGAIDLFLNKMVQETGLELILIQNAQDSIYLSTDKNYENHQVKYLQQALTEMKTLNATVEEAVVAAPIMGSESRLGTCLVIYKLPHELVEGLAELKADSLGGKSEK
jgi:hypothetical protein